MLTLNDIDVKGKVVLVREDLNVPFDEVEGILSTVRIDKALDTIRQLQAKEAKVIVMSHFGRPKGRDERYSLLPIAEYLSKQLDQKVPLFNLGDPLPALKEKSVAMLENVRFYPGESENSESLARQYAALCDVFVMDAFGVSHRAHASTAGIIKAAKLACMGPLLQQEFNMLEKGLTHAERPMIAVVGGAKVSSKLNVLLNLIEKVDTLVVGGALANTFLLAAGFNVGASLVEPELVSMANQIMHRAQALNKSIWLPLDVCVAPNIDSQTASVKPLEHIAPADQIFDIGPRSAQSLQQIIASAKTIVWNGPMGVFEKEPFQQGTRLLAHSIAQSSAYSVAGGGETIAAIEMFGIEEKISYISTGGGAFLEVLEGKTLPVQRAFEERRIRLNEVSV